MFFIAGSVRTYIEEALAAEFFATDGAQNLVRLSANLKITFGHCLIFLRL